MLPVLYSFRRCPYAMRARIALYYSAQMVELREVVLKAKPPELLDASPKATVPVLLLEGRVIDESLEVMQWALEQNDPERWLDGVDGSLLKDDMVREHDQDFKPILDRYKYADRYPEFSQAEYLQQAMPFLKRLQQLLVDNNGYLAGDRFTALDAAIFPFIRQFAHCDLARFTELDLPELQGWLQHCLSMPLFASVMHKYTAWSAELQNSVEFGFRMQKSV